MMILRLDVVLASLRRGFDWLSVVKQWLDTGTKTLLDVTAPKYAAQRSAFVRGVWRRAQRRLFRAISVHRTALKKLRLGTVFVRTIWSATVQDNQRRRLGRCAAFATLE
jgi:hypothetical protein